MITYNPAFDLYHCIFRMAHILQQLKDDDNFEVDKVRIWDFYLLFPSKVYDIHLKRTENEISEKRKKFIMRSKNPYEYCGNNQKLFEWIKPFQVAALNCLVSCGIIDKNDYLNDRISIINHDILDTFVEKTGQLTTEEINVLSFMGYLSRNMPLTGPYGLKARTQLLEFKYDAK